MIYNVKDFDYKTRSWVESTKFKSTVSRLKKGYTLSGTTLGYAYVHPGTPVAPSCLAKWVN